MAGTLSKYIPRNEPLLIGRSWDLRYFIVKRASHPGEIGQLLYWKSDKDVGSFPRGKIQLSDTYLVPEGETYVGPSIWRPIFSNYFWRFKILDSLGSVVIRLSTDSQADYQKWIAALQQAGCKLGSPDAGDMSPSASSAMDSENEFGSAQNLRGISPEVEDTAVSGALKAQVPPVVGSAGYTSDTSEVALRRTITRRARNVDNDKWRRRTGPPVHTQNMDSVLSWRRLKHESHRGFGILLIIWLFAANFRLVIENILKYGIRFDPIGFLNMLLVPKTYGQGPTSLYCWPAMALSAFLSLFIEKLAATVHVNERKLSQGISKKTDEKGPAAATGGYKTIEVIVFLLHLANLIFLLSSVSYVVTRPDADPLPSFVVTLCMITLGMKLVSYQHINWALRQAHRRGEVVPGERGSGTMIPGWRERELPKYPENVSFKSLAYFLVAPTLCYQLAYPWEPLLRLRRILKRFVSLVCLSSLMLFITEQYIEPTIDNSIRPLQEMDWLRMTERILKLAIPTLLYWLIMFYTMFHVWLNLLAELTHFADREFYRQWWNATTLGDYWRLWNMPVHRWMVRHVYVPCLAAGMPKLFAGVMVFFVSAVLHELAVGLPLRMLRAWSFAAIMAQVPLIHWTEYIKSKTKNNDIGNAIFWLTFCFLGQPLALILYFHDFRKQLYA